jgi:hypothetical protein
MKIVSLTPSRKDVRRLNRTVRPFRILKDCDIKLMYDPDNFNCSAGGKMSKQYCVFTWKGPNNQPEPVDYMLHEVLHCVLNELRKLGKRRTRDRCWIEEGVVRDLCGMFRKLNVCRRGNK